MENDNGKKLVSFDYPDGLREAAKECFPELPEDQAMARLISFVSWIISK